MLQLNTVMDIEQKRKLARDILEDEMSDNTLEHISKIDYLQDWIIDAMINFSNKVNNCALDDVMVIKGDDSLPTTELKLFDGDDRIA